MVEAGYYSVNGGKVHCELCPRYCVLTEGQMGYCRSRKAIGEKLYDIAYGKAVSIAIDPIEKKPLYHFHPGSTIISLGPNSCNLSCSFCQNWEISQHDCPTRYISLAELAALVYQQSRPQVAFTYSEPLMWYGFISDFARAYPDIFVVLVTNGFINEKPWVELLPGIAALNIDLKSMRQDFYKEMCGGDVEVVKRSIALAYASGTHMELTYLLIPGLNDSKQELHELGQFVSSLNKKIPLHISAYRPQYKLGIRATTVNEIEQACEIASQYLDFVYAGNVMSAKYGRKA